MGVALGCVLAAMMTGEAYSSTRLDETFARWAEAEKGCRSLVVEFTFSVGDSGKPTTVSNGVLRLARTEGGRVVAGCELSITSGGRIHRQEALLSEGRVYLLDPVRKSAIRWENMEGGAAGFIERNFLPFLLLLDRTLAEQTCRVAVTGEDREFTYLTVAPRTVRKTGWFPDMFHHGQIVITRTGSDTVPADRPQQLWYTDGDTHQRFDITAWRENRPDGPTVKEFIRPEDREGWTVTDPPSWDKLLAKKTTEVQERERKPVPAAAAGNRSKVAPEATGSLTVDWLDSDLVLKGPKFVLVSLYRDGELIRSRELEPFRSPLNVEVNPRPKPTVTWKNLPSGIYEVCFEAKGYGRGVKRVRVSPEDGDELEVHVELDKDDYRLGDGLRAKHGNK